MKAAPVSPRTVGCPNCQAPAEKPCTQPTDTGRREINWYHYARIAAVPTTQR